MNLFWGALIVVVVTALAVTCMLLVRRRAPEGSYFRDGDRAAGVFGVMATGFSVLLGFIIFLAFSSYDASRSGAANEATIVAHQVETAKFLPEAIRGEITGQLICYARSVAGDEWTHLQDGSLRGTINPWTAAMLGTLQGVEPASPSEQSAYDRLMDETADREDARNDRVHSVGGVVPVPLWIVLYTIAVVIFVFMLFFADSAEGAFTQAMLMGGVSVVVTTLLLLLVFLDSPFTAGVGGLRPVAMEQTLNRVDQELQIAGTEVTPPCDTEGAPL